MDAACGQEEAVVFLDLILGEGVGDGVVLDHSLVLLGGNLLLQTAVELGVLVRVHDVPHLGLAALLALALGYLVGGMHLDREVLTGIDKLDEQGELVAEALIVGLAHELVLLLDYQFVELLAGILTVGYHCLVAGHSRDFPAFAYVLEMVIEMLEGDDFVATPDGLLQQSLKL